MGGEAESSVNFQTKVFENDEHARPAPLSALGTYHPPRVRTFALSLRRLGTCFFGRRLHRQPRHADSQLPTPLVLLSLANGFQRVDRELTRLSIAGYLHFVAPRASDEDIVRALGVLPFRAQAQQGTVERKLEPGRPLHTPRRTLDGGSPHRSTLWRRWFGPDDERQEEPLSLNEMILSRAEDPSTPAPCVRSLKLSFSQAFSRSKPWQQTRQPRPNTNLPFILISSINFFNKYGFVFVM